MNDDITRLADRMADAIKDSWPDGDIAVYKVEDWEAELRTLSQQQDKAGGVAVAWVAPYVLDAYIEDGSTGTLVAGPRTGDRTVPIYVTPPAHSPGAGVTDEMVELAARALCEKPPTLIKFDQETETNRAFWRELARAALAAALTAPQPKDAT